MSFSISFTGDDREDAIAKLAEKVDEAKLQGANIPDNVPQLVESVISAVPDAGGDVTVSAYGHFEDAGNGGSNISIAVTINRAVSADPSAGINETVPRADNVA